MLGGGRERDLLVVVRLWCCWRSPRCWGYTVRYTHFSRASYSLQFIYVTPDVDEDSVRNRYTASSFSYLPLLLLHLWFSSLLSLILHTYSIPHTPAFFPVFHLPTSSRGFFSYSPRHNLPPLHLFRLSFNLRVPRFTPSHLADAFPIYTSLVFSHYSSLTWWFMFYLSRCSSRSNFFFILFLQDIFPTRSLPS